MSFQTKDGRHLARFFHLIQFMCQSIYRVHAGAQTLLSCGDLSLRLMLGIWAIRFLIHGLIEVMLRVLQSQEILRLCNVSLSLPIIKYGGFMGDIAVDLFDELVA